MRQSDLIDILLVSSDFIFLSTDKHGKITTVTPACRDVIKKQEGEVEGKMLDEIVPELAFYPQAEFEIVQPRGGLELMLDDEDCDRFCRLAVGRALPSWTLSRSAHYNQPAEQIHS